MSKLGKFHRLFNIALLFAAILIFLTTAVRADRLFVIGAVSMGAVDFNTQTEIFPAVYLNTAIIDHAFSPSSGRIYLLDWQHQVHVVDIATGRLQSTFTYPNSYGRVPTSITVAATPGSDTIAVVANDDLHILDSNIGHIQTINISHPQNRNAGQFAGALRAPAGSLVAHGLVTGPVEPSVARVELSRPPFTVTHHPIFNPTGTPVWELNTFVADTSPALGHQNLIFPTHASLFIGGKLSLVSYYPQYSAGILVPAPGLSPAMPHRAVSGTDFVLVPNSDKLVAFIPSTLSWFEWPSPNSSNQFYAAEIDRWHIWTGSDGVIYRIPFSGPTQNINNNFDQITWMTKSRTQSNTLLFTGSHTNTPLTAGKVTCQNADCSLRQMIEVPMGVHDVAHGAYAF